jgi:hypothetical protein
MSLHEHPTAKYPVAQRVHTQVLEWADELAAYLGRSADGIRSRGLAAGDFPSGSELHILLIDGSTVRFRHAFHLIRESEQALAVFSEHCGYHVFPLHDATVSRVSERLLYPPAQPDT